MGLTENEEQETGIVVKSVHRPRRTQRKRKEAYCCAHW